MKQCLLQKKGAGKSVGQTKLSLSFFFCTQIITKTIDFSIQVKSTSLHEIRKNLTFSGTYFLVYGQNPIRTFSYMDRIYDIRENTDTILCIYEKIRTRESPYFDIFHPVRTVTISIMLLKY